VSVSAKVVAERSATSGNVSSNQGGMVSTAYYATFEFDSGERAYVSETEALQVWQAQLPRLADVTERV